MDNTANIPAAFLENIPKIEEKLGYVFHDPTLLCQAFTRGSFCNEANYQAKIPYQSYQVLEFFGDSVLSAAIVTYFLASKIERYEHGIRTKLDEGGFSNIRSHLSDKSNLSASLKKIGLQEYLLMGNGDREKGIQNEKSVMEDLYESLLGAIYIDSGYSMATVISVMEKTLDFSADSSATDAPEQSSKNALQEFCQDKKRRLEWKPVKLSESGPDHDKRYVYTYRIGGELLGRGEARKQKDAEAIAAAQALRILKAREENGAKQN